MIKRIAFLSIIFFCLVYLFRIKIINQYNKVLYLNSLEKIETLKIQIDVEDELKFKKDRDSIFETVSKHNTPWGYKNKIKYNAELTKNNEITSCNIKIAGHYQDHLKNPTSLKVYCNNKVLLNSELSSSYFNLLNPMTRFLYVDILANFILKDLGLKTLISEPICVKLNKKTQVYLLEESFKSQRLNDQKGFVFTATRKNNEIIFNPVNKIKKNQKKLNQLNLKKLSKHLKIEQFLNYLIISKVFNSYHNLFDGNQRYYFSNKDEKISPIPREFWLVETLQTPEPIIKNIQNDTMLKNKIDPLILFLINDTSFVKRYKLEQIKFANSDNIEKILHNKLEKLKNIEILYWKNYAWYTDQNPIQKTLKIIANNKKKLLAKPSLLKLK